MRKNCQVAQFIPRLRGEGLLARFDKIFKLAQQLEQTQQLERTLQKKELQDLINIILQIRKCALAQQKPETAKEENIKLVIDYTTLLVNKLQKSLQQIKP